jgi:uncharacterized protein YgbK (DUF1537 family)
VTGDADALVEQVRAALRDGAEVLVADALTEDHLRRVADAAVAAAGDVTWVAVDPGPGTVALAAAMGLTGRAAGLPLLAVSGSATELTRAQLARLVGERAAVVVRPVTGAGPVPDVDATAAALTDALDAAGPADVVLLASVLEGSDVVAIDPADAERLPVALARCVRRALEEQAVDGMFTTGGDVTAALLAELGARGLEVEDEVVPLAVAGTLVGGPWSGLPVVSKGGLVGDAATTVACLDHLRRSAELDRRHVRAPSSRTRT